MRSTLKTLALALVVALLCVPAAFAKGKPSWAGGGGQGHGKPAWAGHGEPDWAGQGKGHADTAKTKHANKHQSAESEDATAGDGELNLDDLNPAWFCKTKEAMMDAADAEAATGDEEASGPSSFALEFGTNDNKANAFGMCVSERAHELNSGEAAGASEEQQTCEEQPADEGSGSEGSTESGDVAGTADDGGTDTTDTDTTTTDTTGSDEAGSAEDTSSGDESSSDVPGDQAGDCQNDTSADQGDQAGEDDQADEAGESDQGDEADGAAFARALVRFVII